MAATREVVRETAAIPREELARERFVRVGQHHLQRLLDDQLARSPRVRAGTVTLGDGDIRLAVTILRWRPVQGQTSFRLLLGREDDEAIEVGVVRTGPSSIHSDHWLMKWVVRLYVRWTQRRGDPDPFDHFLMKLDGARRDGDTIFLPVPRQPLTERVGKSRVLRRIAAYATVSSLVVRPGELVIGFHLGRLAERMADMYVLRHLLRDTTTPDPTL